MPRIDPVRAALFPGVTPFSRGPGFLRLSSAVMHRMSSASVRLRRFRWESMAYSRALASLSKSRTTTGIILIPSLFAASSRVCPSTTVSLCPAHRMIGWALSKPYRFMSAMILFRTSSRIGKRLWNGSAVRMRSVFTVMAVPFTKVKPDSFLEAKFVFMGNYFL